MCLDHEQNKRREEHRGVSFNPERDLLYLTTTLKTELTAMILSQCRFYMYCTTVIDKLNAVQIGWICQHFGSDHLTAFFLTVNNIARFLFAFPSSNWYPLWKMTAQNSRIAQQARAALPQRRGEKSWRSTRYCVLYLNSTTLVGLQVWFPACCNEMRRWGC